MRTPLFPLLTIVGAAYPRGALNYWKSSFLAQLSDAAIDTMIECFATCPSSISEVALEHMPRVTCGSHTMTTRADKEKPGRQPPALLVRVHARMP
jgi:hypothetical protein